jgi:integrase
MSNKKELPRGLQWRGDSIVAVFALADGTIERRSLGSAASVSWAVEELARFKRQVREGCYVPKQPRVAEAVYTIADVWKEYIRSYRLAGKKAESRQEIAWRKHLKPVFEKMRPELLSTRDLTAYQEARIGAGAANATVNRELSALSAALYHANGMTGANGKPVLDRVPCFPASLKEAAPRKGFIEDEQYGVLAKNAKPTVGEKKREAGKALWLQTLIACAFAFGFRRGELLGMRVRQVDFFGRWLQLEEGTTKNDEGRKVRMTEEVCRLMLESVRGKNPDDYIFTRENGEHVCDPRDDWYALCVTSGLGRFVPAKRKNGEDYQKYIGLNLHDFRRAAIIKMDRRGVSRSVAMRISGHKTESVYRRYRIVNETDLADATAKIEADCTAGTETSTKTSTSGISSAKPLIQNLG